MQNANAVDVLTRRQRDDDDDEISHAETAAANEP